MPPHPCLAVHIHTDMQGADKESGRRQPSTAALWSLVRAIDSQEPELVRIIKTMLEPCLADLIMNQIKEATEHSQRCTRNTIARWMAGLFCGVVLPDGVDAARVEKVLGKMFGATRLGTQMNPYEGNGAFKAFCVRQPRWPTTYGYPWWATRAAYSPLRIRWEGNPLFLHHTPHGVAELDFQPCGNVTRRHKDVLSKDARDAIADVFEQASCIANHLQRRKNAPVMQALRNRTGGHNAFIRKSFYMLRFDIQIEVFDLPTSDRDICRPRVCRRDILAFATVLMRRRGDTGRTRPTLRGAKREPA